MRRIYFDNASTTRVHPLVYKEMKPYLKKKFGNPSSVNKEGMEARKAIEDARKKISEIFNCYPDEIFFTSGSSENNSWIEKNFHPMSSSFSHDSVSMAIQEETSNDNISIPLIDNEMGKIRTYKGDKTINIHYDLTQSVGKIDIKFYKYKREDKRKTTIFNIQYDLDKCVTASFSAHKFGGPKGIGCLFVRKKFQKQLIPLIYGHQENGLRGGTENVPGIVGMAKALELATSFHKKKNKVENEILEYIEEYLKRKEIKYSKGLGIINITFLYLNSQAAVSILDKEGVSVSSGSACNERTDTISKILINSGYSGEEATNTIRVSLSSDNKVSEAKRFCRILDKIIDKYDKI